MRELVIPFFLLLTSLPIASQTALAVKPLSKLDDKLLAVVPRLTLRETPLRDAVGQLAAAAKVEILSDGKAMEDAGIDLDIPVTLNIEPVSLVNALDALLRPFDLVAIVRDDLLEVTTMERAEQRPFVHVYDVSDLAVDGAGLKTLTAVVQQLSLFS